MNKTYIDINTWNRKEIFNHFISFEEPFHSVVVDIDCTYLLNLCKREKTSFFANYLHRSLIAVNQTKAFKYRIDEEKKVFEYDCIDASATISRPDKTFGFSHIQFNENYGQFKENLDKETERICSSRILFPPQSEDNVIHYSSLPWIKFTSLSHARKYSKNDSVPKMTFGKMHTHLDKMLLPLSIHVNHALVDGYDVAMYIQKFQELMLE
jgi:chloramphenicol O-acetyltransferase type A